MTAIACDIHAIPPAQRTRYETLRANVLAAARDTSETTDGYAFRLGDEVALVAVAEWIAFERLCCPFLRFTIEVDGREPARVGIGGDGVKDFLRAELGTTLLSASSLVRRS